MAIRLSPADPALEPVLRRDRWSLLLVLAPLIALLWFAVWRVDGLLQGFAAPLPVAALAGADETLRRIAEASRLDLLDARGAASVFAIWMAVCAAVMLPAALPVVLFYTRLARRRSARMPHADSVLFVLAYLAAWAVFAALATVAQYALEAGGYFDAASGRVTGAAPALILCLVGAHQWTRAKARSLAHCQSPLGFVMAHWRDGLTGALAMGLAHGRHAITAGAPLMLLMFTAGVTDPRWLAVIGAFVLLERLLPGLPSVTRVPGLVLIALGVWIGAGPALAPLAARLAGA